MVGDRLVNEPLVVRREADEHALAIIADEYDVDITASHHGVGTAE